ncbi:MAG: glycosyltransferase [Pseudomonadota bacterium]
MRIWVVIPSVGRSHVLRNTVAHLNKQVRRPEGVVLVGACDADVEGVAEVAPETTIIIAERGLCAQRNAGMKIAAPQSDLLIFFDDDFVPRTDFLLNAESVFCARQDLVGATGRLIADGARTGPIDFEAACEMVANDDIPTDAPDVDQEALYGCNMLVRTAVLDGLQFDEKLPLYGWQEDVDFTYQVGRRGRMILSPRLGGVHMGVTSGRLSGKRLGYSQIANPIYLLRKRTMPHKLARRLMVRNFSSNLANTILVGRKVGRPSRLLGNMMAIRDYFTGRLDPRRITEF